MESTDKFWIGTKPCGCTVAACSDAPEYEHERERWKVERQLEGMAVELVDRDTYLRKLKPCHC